MIGNAAQGTSRVRPARSSFGQRPAIARDVLDARKHPAIEFRSRPVVASPEPTIEGTLILRGREQRLTLKARRDGDRAVVETTLHQPAFGIRPYTAMLGALRIQPDVRVRITTPWPD